MSVKDWFRRVFLNQSPVKYVDVSPSAFSGRQRIGGNSQAMGSVGTLYSIISLLSTSTASVDWEMYRKQTDNRRVYGPDSTTRREVTVHPALNLWSKPNELMTQYEFIERTQQHIDLIGEAFWVVEKVGSLPVGLWPVHPARMTERISNGRDLIGWIYTAPDSSKVPFDANEVIHIQTPNPDNIFRGLSPVQAIMRDLEGILASTEYNANFFKNNAQPGGYITVPQNLQDEQLLELQRRWTDQHKGIGNAHRVGILEAGMTWQDSVYTMQDMQFAELQNVSREKVREAYGIHQHMLGLSDDVNLANAQAATADFNKWKLLPRLRRLEDALNFQLLPLFGTSGEGVEFCADLDQLFPEDEDQARLDMQANVQAAMQIIAAGGDWDATFEAFGLPPIPQKEPEPVPAQLQQVPNDETRPEDIAARFRGRR